MFQNCIITQSYKNTVHIAVIQGTVFDDSWTLSFVQSVKIT